jgi:hypothetical protein
MPHVDRTPLGAATLARRWYLDVNTGTYAAPVWTAVNGVEDFKAPLDPSVQDDSDYDSGGYKSSTITALGWKVELKLARKVTAASALVYDPGAEVLRAASMNMGLANRVDIRWYEVTDSGPIVEAYRGYATVSWSEDGGGMDALASVSVTLTGQGARATLTHPDFAASVPIVSSVTPAAGAAAGGEPVYIYGQGFTGTVSVKMGGSGGTAFTDYNVVSDTVIVGTVPAKTAGSYQVCVTNATGASTVMPSFTYS